MTFAQLNLNPSISKAVIACGYNQPTPIQLHSIPTILDKKDLVACAQTGTGKTAAFVLPALHLLSMTKTTAKPRVLVLTPTRELATQITQAVMKYGKFLNVKTVSLVGGMSYRQQLKGLSRPVDVIVATPGRLLDHMENRRLDLSGIEMLILDEADRMLDMGFIDDVRDIAKKTPSTRQTLLFSATVDDRLASVVRQLLKDPIRIDLSQEKITPREIKQEIYVADNLAHKNRLLQHFLTEGNIFKAIIFSATKITADNLAQQLKKEGYAAAALHGDLKQNLRNRTVEELRRGKIQFLVATDVAARGIDINDVTHVINYDLPKFSEDYVHRIGRTGRAGKAGVAISFAMPMDALHLKRIEKFTNQKLMIATVPGLEPTKNIHTHHSAPAKKKPFRHKNKKPGQGQGQGSKKTRYEARGEWRREKPKTGEKTNRLEEKKRSQGEFRHKPKAKSFSSSNEKRERGDFSRKAKKFSPGEAGKPVRRSRKKDF